MVTTRRFLRKDGKFWYGDPCHLCEIFCTKCGKFNCNGNECLKYVIPTKKENWILFIINEHGGIVPMEINPNLTIGELQTRIGKDIIPVKEFQLQCDPMQTIEEICINRDMFKVGDNCLMYKVTKLFRAIGL